MELNFSLSEAFFFLKLYDCIWFLENLKENMKERKIDEKKKQKKIN